MKRKHILNNSLLVAFFLFIIPAKAQAQEDPFEEFKSMKIAFVTEKLNLTPAEAEVFWPVYNDFENRRNKIRDERRKLAESFTKNSATMSEAEISKILNDYIGFFNAENKLLIQYNIKLKEILPPSKVMKTHLVEIQFRHHLIDEIRKQQIHEKGKRRGPENIY